MRLAVVFCPFHPDVNFIFMDEFDGKLLVFVGILINQLMIQQRYHTPLNLWSS